MKTYLPLLVDTLLKEGIINETKMVIEKDGVKKENTEKERNMDSSMEEIFKKLEKSEHGLLEMGTLVQKGLLEESDVFKDEKINEIGEANKDKSKVIKDPFDDLFDELDEANLEDVDKGFQQIYAVENNADEDFDTISASSEHKVEEIQLNKEDLQTQTTSADIETEKEAVDKSLQPISESQVKCFPFRHLV